MADYIKAFVSLKGIKHSLSSEFFIWAAGGQNMDQFHSTVPEEEQ